jgi:hypothetical protein
MRTGLLVLDHLDPRILLLVEREVRAVMGAVTALVAG